MGYVITSMQDNWSINNRRKRSKGEQADVFLAETIIDSFKLKPKQNASLPKKLVSKKRQTEKNQEENADTTHEEVLNKLINKIANQKLIIDIQKNLSRLVFFRYKKGQRNSRENIKISDLLQEASKSTESRLKKFGSILLTEQQKIKKLLNEGDYNDYIASQEFQDWLIHLMESDEKYRDLSIKGKESFLSLLCILHKLHKEMDEDVRNVSTSELYNKTHFKKETPHVVKQLEMALNYLEEIMNDCTAYNTFLQFDEMADNVECKQIQCILLECKTDLTLNEEEVKALTSSPNNELNDVMLDLLKRIKDLPLTQKIQIKLKDMWYKIKNVDYLSNMVTNRDELHKSAAYVNSIYQQILFELTQINYWDENKLCPDLNFDFLKDNPIQ